MIDIGSDLELFEDQNIQITRQAKEIRSLQLEESEFSQTFTAPYNKKNNQALGYYANIDVDSTQDPHMAIQARWSFEQTVRFIGVLELKGSIYKDGKPYAYKLVFYGKLRSLATIFGEAKMTDVDWSGYDHDLTWANVLNSWLGILDDGKIMYPLIDTYRNWFLGDPSVNVSGNIRHPERGIILTDLTPSLLFRELMKTVFAHFGLTLVGIIDDPVFDECYIHPKAKSGALVDYEEFNSQMFDVGDSFQNIETQDWEVVDFSTESQDQGNNWNNVSMVGTIWTTGPYAFQFFTTAVAQSSNLLAVEVGIFVDGALEPLQSVNAIDFNSGPGSPTAVIVWGIEGEFIEGQEIQIKARRIVNGLGFLGGVASFFNPRFRVVSAPSVILNATSSLTTVMPDDKIVDFIQGWMKAYRLVLLPGSVETEWKIISEQAYYDQGTERDWSKYVRLDNMSFDKTKVYKKIQLQPAESESAAQKAFEQETGRRFGEVKIETGVDFGSALFKVESPFTLWVPQIMRFLDANNEVTGQSSMAIYKMMDVDGSPTLDKWLMYYMNGLGVDVFGGYYIQTDVDLEGQPIFQQTILFPWVRWVQGIEASDYSTAYSIEAGVGGLVDNKALYGEYWEGQLYDLYAAGSRVAIAEFKLPKSEFFAFELNDVIFVEGRRWIIDKFQYSTATGLAKCTLRSFSPRVDRPKTNGISSGGKSNNSDLDSFVATSKNLIKRGNDFYFNGPAGGVVSNPLRYTEAAVQNISTYITNIVNLVTDKLRSYDDDWDLSPDS